MEQEESKEIKDARIKEWQKLKREQRKNAFVIVKGTNGKGVRKIRGYAWIEEMIPTMIGMNDADTGVAFDHRKEMRKMWMDFGVDGVNEYLEIYNEAFEKGVEEIAEKAAGKFKEDVGSRSVRPEQPEENDKPETEGQPE